MKSFFLTLLSAIIFMASFQNTLLLVDYKINTAYYELHCVNKSKPEMNCHGKCGMKKESEKSNSPFKLQKYSFDFNMLPYTTWEVKDGATVFVLSDQPLFFTMIHETSAGFADVLPDPPQG